MNRVAALLLITSILVPSYLSAHEFNPAHLVLNEIDEVSFEYHAQWMYPKKNIGQRGEVVFPLTCSRVNESLYYQGKYVVENIKLDCESSIKGDYLEITDLSVLTDALVTINYLDGQVFEGLINLRNSKLLVPKKITIYGSGYFNLGLAHLFSGLDHILFLLGLLLIVSGFFNVIKTVTAFTLAHSITLALSVTGAVLIPQSTVEILIAVTIVYLALEISQNKLYKTTPWFIAFGFGLLHGFGFASALTEIGLSDSNLFYSLLFFNIGIEIGQILVILIFLLCIYVIKRSSLQINYPIFISYLLGGVGFYWVIDRSINMIL